jgi:hypothetical protein
VMTRTFTPNTAFEKISILTKLSSFSINRTHKKMHMIE